MTADTNVPAVISPGRAACEAFWAAIGAGPDVQEPGEAWNWARSQGATGAWEAAAKAAAGACSARPSPEADAERLEAAAAVLNRRYPATRPDELDHIISSLQSLARTWRRMAAQAADRATGAEAAK